MMTNYHLIKKSLSQEQLLEIYNKIQPYKPHTDEYNFNNDETAMYTKRVKDVHLIKKVPYDQISNSSYLWNATRIDSVTDTDKRFIADYDSLEKYVAYGLHTYGKYHEFFRPDLDEVMNLLVHELPDVYASLDKYECIYFTTDMHPSSDINECFDGLRNRHRAKTTYVPILKDEGPTRKKIRIT